LRRWRRCSEQNHGVAGAHPTQLATGQRLDRFGIGTDRLGGFVELGDALLEFDGPLSEALPLFLGVGQTKTYSRDRAAQGSPLLLVLSGARKRSPLREDCHAYRRLRAFQNS